MHRYYDHGIVTSLSIIPLLISYFPLVTTQGELYCLHLALIIS